MFLILGQLLIAKTDLTNRISYDETGPKTNKNFDPANDKFEFEKKRFIRTYFK